MKLPNRYKGTKGKIHLRVSSKEQEDGYSIQSQLRTLYEYASRLGIIIVGDPIIEIASAKSAGRKVFDELVKFLKAELRKPKGRRIDQVLTEKSDRLTRNHVDKETLLQLGVTIHLVKEGIVVNHESSSGELFVFDNHVSNASRYSRNLGEEASKGMREKAKEGWYPSNAPIGYINTVRSDEKKIISTDPVYGPIVAQMFQLYATGRYSLAILVTEINETIKRAGLKRKLCKSVLAKILDNPFYYGIYLWNGIEYKGKHRPIITKDTFDQVQSILHGSNKHVRQALDKDKWLFQGMIFCYFCGCAIIAEKKKGRYIYYHCTGNKGDCTGTRVVEQAAIETQVVALLERLSKSRFPLDRFSTIVKDSQVDARERHKIDIIKTKNDISQQEQRRHELLMRSLDGKIDDERYHKTDEQLEQNIAEHQKRLTILATDKRLILETQEQLSALLKKAVDLFQQPSRPDSEKRQLLKTFLGRCQLNKGRLIPTLRPPFNQYVPIGS